MDLRLGLNQVKGYGSILSRPLVGGCMAHDHSGGAAALALAPGAAAAWSPARFGFSSYDV
jgi:hypothetical protein